MPFWPAAMTVTTATTETAALTQLPGVGPALAAVLAKLNLCSVQDLLFHLPLRYLDRTRLTAIGGAALHTTIAIEGTVQSTRVVMGKRRSLVVQLQDDSGVIALRFYHFSAAQKNRFAEGARIRCFGDTRLGQSGLELYHPETQVIDPQNPTPLDNTLTPIYPLTEGIGQPRMRKLVLSAINALDAHPPEELLPIEFNQRFGVSSLAEALQFVHCPPVGAPVAMLQAGTHPCQQRLAFEELLAHHLALQKSRAAINALHAPRLALAPKLSQQFYQSLPFSLTRAQTRVIADIQQDLQRNHPMLRLVQGDVGSGKTVVAAATALAALSSGQQVALAAPTEILAEQHLHNFEQWLKPLGYQVAWLVGKLTKTQRQKALNAIATGEAQLVVGTHALFQEDVQFKQLGLVIIDEQHRFGVHQRLSLHLKSDGLRPHQLVMTATPIPRTLAMTAYADLDLSVIDELPPGRTPVNTVLVSQKRKDEVVARVKNACTEGRQVYWVCTLVEDSETLSAAAAEQTAEALRTTLPELSVGLVHGRLKPKDKAQAMAAFKNGETQLLVATTVIEVGVDVPNASVMVIENPERLGLAQLHQLRGRVGRGPTASFCLLLYGEPLSQMGRRRLQVLRDSNDGFAIAEHDLSIRGPGELLGARQTGTLNFRIADLERDAELLSSLDATANQIARLPPHIGAKIINRWFANHEAYLQG